jgi:hypothetical protein
LGYNLGGFFTNSSGRPGLQLRRLPFSFKIFLLWLNRSIPGTEERAAYPPKMNLFRAGMPDFSWYDIPKRIKIFKITTKYTKPP